MRGASAGSMPGPSSLHGDHGPGRPTGPRWGGPRWSRRRAIHGHSDGDVGPRWRVADRVPDQVVEDLAQPVGIPLDDHRTVPLDHEAPVGGRDGHPLGGRGGPARPGRPARGGAAARGPAGPGGTGRRPAWPSESASLRMCRERDGQVGGPVRTCRGRRARSTRGSRSRGCAARGRRRPGSGADGPRTRPAVRRPPRSRRSWC